MASILRYNKAVLPFLKNSYIETVVSQMTTHINNKKLTKAALIVIKLLCMDPMSVELVVG